MPVAVLGVQPFTLSSGSTVIEIAVAATKVGFEGRGLMRECIRSVTKWVAGNFPTVSGVRVQSCPRPRKFYERMGFRTCDTVAMASAQWSIDFSEGDESIYRMDMQLDRLARDIVEPGEILPVLGSLPQYWFDN